MAQGAGLEAAVFVPGPAAPDTNKVYKVGDRGLSIGGRRTWLEAFDVCAATCAATVSLRRGIRWSCGLGHSGRAHARRPSERRHYLDHGSTASPTEARARRVVQRSSRSQHEPSRGAETSRALRGEASVGSRKDAVGSRRSPEGVPRTVIRRPCCTIGWCPIGLCGARGYANELVARLDDGLAIEVQRGKKMKATRKEGAVDDLGLGEKLRFVLPTRHHDRDLWH